MVAWFLVSFDPASKGLAEVVDDHNWRGVMKPVVLFGKGPSARKLDVSDNYVVGAVNSAFVFCDRVDYFFLQDVETLANVRAADIPKLKTAVIPAHPFEQHKQRASLTYTSLLGGLAGIERFAVYQNPLESDGIAPIEGLPRIDNICSGGDAAVAWLLAEGHRDFVFVGIDPSGGHHPKVQKDSSHLAERRQFSVQCPSCEHAFSVMVTKEHASASPNPPEWYKLQYQSLVSKIIRVGGTFRHLGPDEGLDNQAARCA